MKPSKEQFEAYKFFMSKMPLLKKPLLVPQIKFFLSFATYLPLLLFIAQNFMEVNKSLAEKWILGFSSFVMFVLVITLLGVWISLLMKTGDPQRWLKLYESNFTGIVSNKAETVYKRKSLTKMVLLWCVVGCMFYFGLHILSGLFLVVSIIAPIMIKKSDEAEIAIVGEAILKNQFNPPKLGLIKK